MIKPNRQPPAKL